MTRDELLGYEANTPVRLLDGTFGLLIRYWQTSAGVQVPSEEQIRDIPLERLVDLGNGALQETKEENDGRLCTEPGVDGRNGDS